MGKNFTPRAQQVLVLARKEAEDAHRDVVSDVNIASALVTLGQGAHYQVWKTLGFDMEAFQRGLSLIDTPAASAGKAFRKMPYTAAASRLLEIANAEKKALDHAYLGTEHLLLALFKIGGPVTELIGRMGLRYKIVRDQVLKELDPNFVLSPHYQSPEVEPRGTTNFGAQGDDQGFEILIDPGSATPEEIAEVFEALSELNRAVGGAGMIFNDCHDGSRIVSGTLA